MVNRMTKDIPCLQVYSYILIQNNQLCSFKLIGHFSVFAMNSVSFQLKEHIKDEVIQSCIFNCY
jgi:hypothetical protein